jgi:hypothetical protein
MRVLQLQMRRGQEAAPPLATRLAQKKNSAKLTVRTTRTSGMKVTDYFRNTRARTDRAAIVDEWIQRACRTPEYRRIQEDGRIQCWIRIPAAGNRFLRVVLLPDGETIHNAFFDRRFKP